MVSPIMSYMSDSIERQMNDDYVSPKFSIKTMISDLVRSIRINLRNLSKELIITIGLLIFSLFPGAAVVTAPLIFLVQAYYAGFGILDYWMERHYRVADSIGYLHDGIGKNFLESIIKPEIRSVTREVIGNYLPEELYSTKREAIEDEIYALTRVNIEAKYLKLDAILIRDVTLPSTLRTAIEQKLKQEQESLEYEFKIDKARKEAERKEIEANGIAKFQKIVNQTITPQLLKWKGVEATQEIAKSSNSKVIVIGNGDGDLPIILGGQ